MHNSVNQYFSNDQDVMIENYTCGEELFKMQTRLINFDETK